MEYIYREYTTAAGSHSTTFCMSMSHGAASFSKPGDQEDAHEAHAVCSSQHFFTIGAVPMASERPKYSKVSYLSNECMPILRAQISNLRHDTFGGLSNPGIPNPPPAHAYRPDP